MSGTDLALCGRWAGNVEVKTGFLTLERAYYHLGS
jgi:hypothetical protein